MPRAQAKQGQTPPSHVGETQIVHRVATDETGEQITGGSVMRVTRREATDETGETIAGGSAGTEAWSAPAKSKA